MVVLHHATLVDQTLQVRSDARLLRNLELEREHRRLRVHLSSFISIHSRERERQTKVPKFAANDIHIRYTGIYQLRTVR